MVTVTLGSTGITVNKNGFGALPIQRISKEDAVYLLRKARQRGIDFFDTARAYSDSEEKLGAAFGGNWEGIYVASKTAAKTPEDLWEDLRTSLQNLQADHIDIYQLHNPDFCPKPGDGSGLYEALLEAKAKGLIRHIGITNHRLKVAQEAIESGLYETLQFPFSYLSSEKELSLVEGCKKANMGFIAMKALAGGLIRNASAAYAWQAQYDNVLPIWGVQREWELDAFLACVDTPVSMTEYLHGVIQNDRAELSGDFCRGCGYCMPCPAGILISDCARMALMRRRAPSKDWYTPTWQANMEHITQCLHCNQCSAKCPYGLDTPQLLIRNLEDYRLGLKNGENC